MPELSAEELDCLDKQAVEYEITMLEEKLNQMTPNMAAIEEYRRKVGWKGVGGLWLCHIDAGLST